MDEITTACEVCHDKNAKYTCPACSTRTCSALCVKRHKMQTECAGFVDLSQFVSRDDLGTDATHLHRDYNFLARLGRNVHVGIQDVQSQARNVFKRQYKNRPDGASKRFHAASPPTLTYDRNECVRRAFFNDPVTLVKRENTLVVYLPAGMGRATSNKSGFDKRISAFVWTVEWIILGNDNKEQGRVVIPRVSESKTILESVPEAVLKGLDANTFTFYLKNVVERGKHGHSLIELNKTLLISQALANMIVLEYPTILLSPVPQPQDMVKLPQDAYKVVNVESQSPDSDERTKSTVIKRSDPGLKVDLSLDSKSDSDSDSDSGSDSDSDSDSDSNSSSDSDSSQGPPEEFSTRHQPRDEAAIRQEHAHHIPLAPPPPPPPPPRRAPLANAVHGGVDVHAMD